MAHLERIKVAFRISDLPSELHQNIRPAKEDAWRIQWMKITYMFG